MPDTHNLNAALYAVLVENGITEVKKVKIDSKEKEIEFIDQTDRKIRMNVTITETAFDIRKKLFQLNP